MIPGVSPSLPGDSSHRRDLLAWGGLSLLGVFSLLANSPAPRRIFLALALLAAGRELFCRPRNFSAGLAFIPWVLLVLLSAAWSPAPATSTVDALQEAVLPLLACLLAVSLASRLDWRYLWWPFASLALAAVWALFGALHVHAGFWPDAPKWLIGAYAGRGVASTLGVFLVLTGVALVLTLRRRSSHMGCYLPYLGVVLLVLGVGLGALGYNRMFWVAVLIGLGPWLIGSAHMTKRWRLLIGGGGGLAILAGLVYSSYWVSTQSGLATEQTVLRIAATYADDPRWLLWQSWLPVVTERPLLGFGFGSRILPLIGVAHVTTGLPEFDWAAQHHAHNVLFNVVIQTGLIGLLAFLLVLYGVWRLVFKAGAQLGQDADHWRWAAISLLLAGLAKSMTDDFFWGPAGIVMWLLLGIMAGIGRRAE